MTFSTEKKYCMCQGVALGDGCIAPPSLWCPVPLASPPAPASALPTGWVSVTAPDPFRAAHTGGVPAILLLTASGSLLLLSLCGCLAYLLSRKPKPQQAVPERVLRELKGELDSGDEGSPGPRWHRAPELRRDFEGPNTAKFFEAAEPAIDRRLRHNSCASARRRRCAFWRGRLWGVAKSQTPGSSAQVRPFSNIRVPQRHDMLACQAWTSRTPHHSAPVLPKL